MRWTSCLRQKRLFRHIVSGAFDFRVKIGSFRATRRCSEDVWQRTFVQPRTVTCISIVGTFSDVTLVTTVAFLAEAQCSEWTTNWRTKWHTNMWVAAVIVVAGICLEMHTSRDAMIGEVVREIAILARRANPASKKGFADCHLGWIVGKATLGPILACSCRLCQRSSRALWPASVAGLLVAAPPRFRMMYRSL